MEDQLLRPAAAAALLGVSAATLGRMRKRGDLPQPVKISQRAIGWKRSQLDEWVTSRNESSAKK